MMMLKRNSEVLITNLNVANTFWSRFMGLMGKSSMSSSEAIMFPKCNAIHTCFMKFSIDCVFLDKSGRVRKVYRNLAPWRLAGPVWGAAMVIELIGGSAERLNIQEGDQLICGH